MFRRTLFLTVLAIGFTFFTTEISADETKWTPKAGSQFNLNDVRVVKITEETAGKPMLLIDDITFRMHSKTVEVERQKLVPEQRTRTIQNPDGTTKVESYTVMHHVIETVNDIITIAIPEIKKRQTELEHIQAWNLKSEPVEASELKKQLANQQHIILLPEPIAKETKPDPFYNGVLRTDLLLIYIPKDKLKD